MTRTSCPFTVYSVVAATASIPSTLTSHGIRGPSHLFEINRVDPTGDTRPFGAQPGGLPDLPNGRPRTKFPEADFGPLHKRTVYGMAVIRSKSGSHCHSK